MQSLELVITNLHLVPVSLPKCLGCFGVSCLAFRSVVSHPKIDQA